MTKTIIKIPRSLFAAALEDLARPHRFAYERVGFFSTKCSTTKNLTLVHCIEYHPVADVHYIRDRSVGARINSAAITEAMARCTNSGVGQIHVHTHGESSGLPNPSTVDRTELPGLIRSLRNVSETNSCGWAILSADNAWLSVVLPRNNVPIERIAVSIIGSRMVVSKRIPCRPKRFWLTQQSFFLLAERFKRQSFLGPESSRIFSTCTIGLVGLGGSGSHANQQLAHLGFECVVMSDGDRVTATNLNRTVNATTADVRRKRSKTDLAERYYRRVLKGARIVNRRTRWENAMEELMACNIIVGSLDTFAARSDLEAFCRRHLIPYVDVGMDVIQSGAFHEIVGQVILSMPGKPCMRCMGFLTDKLLSREAQSYGVAGGRPQVIWSNGVLCSAAVGIVVDLLTGWSGRNQESLYLNFRGSDLSLTQDPRLEHVIKNNCPHYPLTDAGDPAWSRL